MMAKRFTDTNIWDKEWFMDLSPKLKCLIRYLFDNCDAAGVWVPNWKLATLRIGEAVNIQDMNLIPREQWELIGGGKIFLPDFINFQYGKLSEASPAHKPIFAAIKKHSLSDRVFNRVSNTLQEKDKEKEKEKEEDKEGGVGETFSGLIPDMMHKFKKANPNYPNDPDHDFPALNQIAQFIAKQSGISYQPQEEVVKETILEAWEIICNYIRGDSFYQDFALRSIKNNIQTITQKIRNDQSTHKNGKQAARGGKVTGSEINEAYAKFYNQGQPLTGTG